MFRPNYGCFGRNKPFLQQCTSKNEFAERAYFGRKRLFRPNYGCFGRNKPFRPNYRKQFLQNKVFLPDYWPNNWPIIWPIWYSVAHYYCRVKLGYFILVLEEAYHSPVAWRCCGRQASSGVTAVDSADAAFDADSLPFALPFCPFTRTATVPRTSGAFQATRLINVLALNYLRGSLPRRQRRVIMYYILLYFLNSGLLYKVSGACSTTEFCIFSVFLIILWSDKHLTGIPIFVQALSNLCLMSVNVQRSVRSLSRWHFSPLQQR